MQNKKATVQTLLNILSELRDVPTLANGSMDMDKLKEMSEVKAVITLLKFIKADLEKFPVAQMLLGNIYAEGETGKCILCGGKYYHYGNNAQPLADGRCCDSCNNDVVTARIKGMRKEA